MDSRVRPNQCATYKRRVRCMTVKSADDKSQSLMQKFPSDCNSIAWRAKQ